MKAFSILVSLMITGTSFAASLPVVESSPAPLAIYVRFASIGSGVDRDAKAAIQSILGVQLALGNVVRYTSKMTGIEGETEICAQFSSYTGMVEASNQVESVKSKLVVSSSATDCK